ncbi:MAG: hypothetical protein KF708_23785 [Pirellulales bacterium]|nr:hypothetical protein [Pirellulales bacterium]
MWLGFAYPGDPDQFNHGPDTDPFNDNAFFGTGYIAPNEAIPYRYATGGTVYFGDFGAIHAPLKGGPTNEQAAAITNRNLYIQSGDWVFDFGAYGYFHHVGTDSGSYTVNDLIVIGQNVRHTGAAGDATLTVRNGVLHQDIDDNWAGLVLGSGLGVQGKLIVDGAGATVDITKDIGVGDGGGTGRIEVINGGQLRAKAIGTGINFGPNGEMPTGYLMVDGVGSTMSGFAGLNNGSATFRNGAKVDSHRSAEVEHWVFLGLTDGADASVTVTGEGTEWTGIDRLTIGGVYHTDSTGSGHLTIEDGGYVSSKEVSVANRSQSQGEVHVNGVGAVWEASLMLLGDDGHGTVTVDNYGSMITGAGGAAIGRGPNGNGAVSVGGHGSWHNAGNLIVGEWGTGELNVHTGGDVQSQHGRIGVVSSSQGAAIMRGVGSSWTVAENLNVGELGLGLLDVGTQAEVHVGNRLSIGEQGTVRLSNGSGRINVGAGTLDATPQGTLRLGPGGVLAGTGTVEGNVLIDGGLVAPGFSPGTLTIDGSLTYGSSSTLSMEIGGLAKGIDYDHMSVSGDLSLGGMLELSFINGFRPSELDSFELFSVGGSFDDSQLSIVWLGVPQGFQYHTYLDEAAYGVVITAVPEPSTLVLGAVAACGGLGIVLRRRTRRESLRGVEIFEASAIGSQFWRGKSDNGPAT